MSDKSLENKNRDSGIDSNCHKLTDIFTILETGVRETIRLGEKHPLVSEYKETFYSKLTDFLNNNSTIPLQVKYSSLNFGDHDILQNNGSDQNIATILYCDGIRILEFSEGITLKETNDLFAALYTRMDKPEDGTDIADLFHKAKFENITYEVIDYINISEISTTNAEQTNHSEIETDSFESSLNFAEAVRNDFQETEEVNDFLYEIKLSENEEEMIKQLVIKSNESNYDQKVMQLNLDIASNPFLEQSISVIIETLKQSFDIWLTTGKYKCLTKYLQCLKSIIKNYNNLSSTHKDHLKSIVNRSGDKIRIKILTEQLNSKEDIDLEEVKSFLHELNWNATTNLVSMLGDLNSYSARMMLCNILSEIDHDKIDIIGSSIFDNRWYLVRNIATILGDLKDSRALHFLKKTVEHQDIRVRSEGIKALRKIGGNESADILVQLLTDPDENIRIMAASELSLIQSSSVFKKLVDTINSKEFSTRSLTEMRLIMEAMINCGGDDAVEIVAGIARKSLFLSKQKMKTIQEIAVNALQISDSPQAPIIFKKIISSGKTHLKNIAKKALVQLEFRLREKEDE